MNHLVLRMTVRDRFVLKRPQGGANSEGLPNTALTTLGSQRGTWGSASSRDRQELAQRGESVDAVIATTVDLRVGDVLDELRGASWRVTHVRPLVTHRRVFLVREDR